MLRRFEKSEQKHSPLQGRRRSLLSLACLGPKSLLCQYFKWNRYMIVLVLIAPLLNEYVNVFEMIERFPFHRALTPLS